MQIASSVIEKHQVTAVIGTFRCDQNTYHEQCKAKFYFGAWIQMVTWSFGSMHLSRT